ncbi:MAG: energy-coupling factor transporter transmembrane component T [Eubacteriales bacterium]|nr:energy-coupling factor transporter transmembrane component T [Eubacteriales bacterium]
MKDFSDLNPITIFIYFFAVIFVAMFCMNPVILAVSLAGAVCLFMLRNGAKQKRSHAFFFLMFIVMALINPLFYHNGVTVLFVMNDNPVTLEALLYGIAASAMIIAVLYWFRSFSQLMTSDRLLYIFGSVSPKTALIISMSLRFVPLFGTQAKRIDQAQKALGLYKEDNAVDAIRGKGRVFSVMTTWALENGIVTADSMTARGYGTGKRTFYSLYRFSRFDAVLIASSLALFALTMTAAAYGTLDFVFYPAISPPKLTPFAFIAYLSYCVLVFIPVIIEAEERLKWKYLLSKI